MSYLKTYSSLVVLTMLFASSLGLLAITSDGLAGSADAIVTRAFSGGDGSVEDPFQISNVDQLQDMSLNLTANYVLINDIDASITIKWNSGEGFIPVGGNAIEDWFQGSLDGQGYNITGLFINRTTSYVGLFGFVGGSTGLKNIGLIDNYVHGSGKVGGLAGESMGIISNCFTTGVVIGTGNDIGGLTGSSNDLLNCYSTGDVSGANSVGGLTGSSNGDVSNCYATGSVKGNDEIGGLAGHNWALTSNCFASGNVSGRNVVGGFAGFNWDSISNCYATGFINGSGSNDAGFLGADGGSVDSCFWDLNTSGKSSSGGGTGKTTAEMMAKETFSSAGWDLTSVWDIIDDVSYPFLRYFYHAPLITFSEGEATEVDEDSFFTANFKYAISPNPAQNSIRSISFDTNASWLTWDGENNTIYGTPANDDVGSYFFNLTVHDLVDKTGINITIFVLNTNDAPEIDLVYGNATEDIPFVIELLALDIDPTEDILNWTLESGPAWLELNTTSNTLNGTPLNSDVGPHSVNVSVVDGNDGSDWENFTLFVENVNDDPIIITTPATSTLQDELYSVFLNATDEDPVELNLTWSVNSNANWLELNGTYLNGTPGNFDVGTFWVNITVTDGEGGSHSLNYTMAVVDINDRPVWSVAPGDMNITEGETLFLDCLATDVDDDDITYSISTIPASDLTINPSTGSIRWGSSDIGTYTVTLTATDGILAVHHTFSIIVEAIPDDDLIDTDNDGMPDVWEKRYGLNFDDPSDASLDLDGDGITNLDEFKQGSDPTVDLSSDKEGSNTIFYLIVGIIMILIVIVIVVIVVISRKNGSEQDEE